MSLKNILSFLFVEEAIKTDITFLRKIDTFKMFSTWQLKKIILLLHRRIYATNEVIYKRNDPANLICLIKSGSIEIDDGSTKKYLKETDIFGERCLFIEDERYIDSAKAVEKSELYFIHKADLATLMENDTNIGFKISKQLLKNFFNKR